MVKQAVREAITKYTIRNVELAELPVGVDRIGRTLTLLGKDMPFEEWLEIRRRIDLMLKHELTPEEWIELKEKMAWLGKRDRLPGELQDHVQPATQPAGDFLTRNWRQVTNHSEGTMKKAPWWLRWLYSAVVTKEQYVKP